MYSSLGLQSKLAGCRARAQGQQGDQCTVFASLEFRRSGTFQFLFRCGMHMHAHCAFCFARSVGVAV